MGFLLVFVSGCFWNLEVLCKKLVFSESAPLYGKNNIKVLILNIKVLVRKVKVLILNIKVLVRKVKVLIRNIKVLVRKNKVGIRKSLV